MAVLTKVELRNRVAEDLKVSSPDVELDANSAQRIDNSIDDARAELAEKGLCWWTENAIPQSVAFALTLIISAQACRKFGKAGQGYEAGDADGRTRLATLKNSADIPELRADYF